jgi:hypothetical protein
VWRGSGQGTVGRVGGARFVDEIGFAFGWIAPEPRLAFALERVSLAASGVEAGKIREIGISRHRAEDLLRIERPERGVKLASAIAFLDDELREGPKLVKELIEKAKQSGISEQTLKRARQALSVESTKLDYDRGWSWSLPVAESGGDEARER